MIEIPESIVLAKQLNDELKNKRIAQIIANSSPHKFAWYHEDPNEFPRLFTNKKIEAAYAYGGKVHIKLSEDCGFMFCDGTNIRYYIDKGEIPKKHQLCIEFDDATYLVCTVRLYGGISGYKGVFDYEYDTIAKIKVDVFSEDFNLDYFYSLLENNGRKKLSAKAFLATEQRIPGLGNGVVQDILFHAVLSPRHDMNTLDREAVVRLFDSTKKVLLEMTQKGGRDVETDIYGNPGGYKTIMSQKTYHEVCPRCGGMIKKEAYLGGNVYYCQGCQE